MEKIGNDSAERSILAKIIKFNQKFPLDVIFPMSVDYVNLTYRVMISKRDYIFTEDPSDYVRMIFKPMTNNSFTLLIDEY